jgi:hypothetical protein
MGELTAEQVTAIDRVWKRCELCGSCPRCCMCEYGGFENGVPICDADCQYAGEPKRLTESK